MGSFVTELESTEVAEPAHRAFDNVPRLSQAAAVTNGHALIASRGNQRVNSALGQGVEYGMESVGGVPLQHLGLASRSTDRALDRRDRVQQRDDLVFVALIGGPSLHGQRRPLSVGDYVTLTAFFAAIRRVRAGVRPPKSARMLALSITARERSSSPRLPKALSRRLRTSSHTPAIVHSCNRRQQVLPLHPSSVGYICHARPVLRTKMIPVKHTRSSTRGAPPNGDGTYFGNNGSISDQSSSGNNAAIRSLLATTVMAN